MWSALWSPPARSADECRVLRLRLVCLVMPYVYTTPMPTAITPGYAIASPSDRDTLAHGEQRQSCSYAGRIYNLHCD